MNDKTQTQLAMRHALAYWQKLEENLTAVMPRDLEEAIVRTVMALGYKKSTIRDLVLKYRASQRGDILRD